jgi:hypothetical protein
VVVDVAGGDGAGLGFDFVLLEMRG